MRVLHVVVSMNAGGIESMLMNLYRAIDRDKIQFDFLVHLKEKSFFEDEIKALGGHVYRIKPLRVNNLAGYRKELNEFFNRHHYDIVHSHISVWSYFVLKAAKKCGVSVRIAHSHEAHDSIWGHRLHRVPMIFTLRQIINKPLTDRLACGQAAGKWLFGNQPFTVLNNAIDTRRFVYDPSRADAVKQQLGLSGKVVFGHVGRFHVQKNHEFLIKVFAALLKQLPQAHLVLIGTGGLQATVEKQVHQLGIEQSVSFLGIRKDIPDLLMAMDYVLMPSLFEGLPVFLVEAQASGVKVFASNTISQEVKITDDLVFLEIDDENTWVKNILSGIDYERKNNSDKIKAAGYDVSENAKWLTQYYLELTS